MVTLQLEKVADIRGDLDTLARLEHAEMEIFRPYGPDWEGFIAYEKAGTFKCLTARAPEDNSLVGYLSWMIDFDLESYGTLIVHQCAWYVKPHQYGVASKMFHWAIREFKRLGVKIVYLHNAQLGRGQTLGRFFTRIGAIHVSNTYALKLDK